MYKVGDKVTYSPHLIKATVIRALADDQYTVEFEDNKLIPPQMDVPGHYLSLIEELHVLPDAISYTYKGVFCPRCSTKWTETIINYKVFYDCLKCNLKREDA